MNKFLFTAAAFALLAVAGVAGTDNLQKKRGVHMNHIANDTRIFRINPEIQAQEIRFQNRFGIELAGHLYLPRGFEPEKRYPAVAVCGPFGAAGEAGSAGALSPCGSLNRSFPSFSSILSSRQMCSAPKAAMCQNFHNLYTFAQ